MPNTNRDKSIRHERDTAAYFRLHGIAEAERKVSAGWRNALRSHADSGDIKDIPGITVQCKYLAKPLLGKALDDAMAETAEQCIAAGNAIPLLIEKRHGIADVGYSYAWLPGWAYVLIATGTDSLANHYPVRMELRYIIEYLVIFSKGYSDERPSNSSQR